MATVTQAELRKRALAAMEDELRIPDKNAKDFVDSLRAVTEEAIEDGDKVALFGIVNLTPTGVPAKPKRKGRNPQTGEETTLAPKPAGLKLRVGATKNMKDALPSPTTKAGKALIAEAKKRAEAAAERRAVREAEAEKAAKKAAKSSGKKSAGKKK